MANAKAGQDDLLMTVPVARRMPQTNRQSQLTKFIVVRNTLAPSGLPSGEDGFLKRTKVVHKREGEVNF